MSLRKLGAVLLAVLAIGVVTASSAFAAPSTIKGYWLVKGATPSPSASVKCSKASEKISLKGTIAGVSTSITATGVECPTGSKIENATVEQAEMAIGSGTLKLTGVTLMEPAGCGIAETITTESLATKLEMDGESIYDRIAPATGTRLASFKITGCAIAGTYPLTGFVRGLLANKTGVEKANQVIKFNSTSNAFSELKLAGNTATLEGETNNELVSGNEFTAVEIGGSAPAFNVSLEPVINQAGMACPLTAGGRAEFTAVGDWCEYKFKNENAAEWAQVVKVEFISGCGACAKSVAVAAGNTKCEEPGIIFAGTFLAAAGGECFLRIEYKEKVKEILGSLEVKARSPMGAEAFKIKGQFFN